MVAIAGAAATLAAGYMSSEAQKSAGRNAAGAQSDAAQAGIDAQNQRFAEMQKLLSPYVQAGYGALGAQQNLIGLGGADAQKQAIDALQNSPMFQSQLQQGNNSILANASATGGLRGGNVQGALGQFSPALLAATINDQYTRLGGITSLGQNSAAMVGNGGMQNANQVSNLYGQMGQAQAGGYLNGGLADARMYGNFNQAMGMYMANRPQGQQQQYNPANVQAYDPNYQQMPFDNY